MNILYIVKEKIIVLIKWWYRSPQICWLLNLKYLSYSEHAIQPLLNTCLFGIRSWCNIPQKYRCPHKKIIKEGLFTFGLDWAMYMVYGWKWQKTYTKLQKTVKNGKGLNAQLSICEMIFDAKSIKNLLLSMNLHFKPIIQLHQFNEFEYKIFPPCARPNSDQCVWAFQTPWILIVSKKNELFLQPVMVVYILFTTTAIQHVTQIYCLQKILVNLWSSLQDTCQLIHWYTQY